MKIISKIKKYFKDRLGRFILTNKDLNMSALDIAIDVATGNNISGDYLEFGVYRGESFARAFKRFDANNSLEQRRFIAFDSFEGLPDSEESFKPKHFIEGAYMASLEEFKKNIIKEGVDISQVMCVQGFYDKSLIPETKKIHKIKKAAVVYIDVDLYQSAVPVFDFLTDIVETGSVIVIDDWFRHLGVPTAGIQKACNEWLEKNKNIELVLLHQYRRVSFIVHKKNEK